MSARWLMPCGLLAAVVLGSTHSDGQRAIDTRLSITVPTAWLTDAPTLEVGKDPKTGRLMRQKTFRWQQPAENSVKPPIPPTKYLQLWAIDPLDGMRHEVGGIAETYGVPDAQLLGPVATLTAFEDEPRSKGTMVLRFKWSSKLSVRAEGIPWWIEFVNANGGNAASNAFLGIMSQAVNVAEGPRYNDIDKPANDFDLVSRLRLQIEPSGKFVR